MIKVNLYHFKKGRSAWFEIACTGSNEAVKLEAHPDLHHVALMDLQGSQNLRHNQSYSKNPGYAITEYNRQLVAKDGTIYSRPKSPNKNYKVNPEAPTKKKAVKRKASPAQLKARAEFARRVRAGEFRK